MSQGLKARGTIMHAADNFTEQFLDWKSAACTGVTMATKTSERQTLVHEAWQACHGWVLGLKADGQLSNFSG